MLFISRCVMLEYSSHAKEHIGFGIVDTDDGVEEVISMDEMEKIVHRTGIRIEGTEVCGRRIDNASPYQHPDYATALQTKLEVMSHIRITLYKDWITSIIWDVKDIVRPVTIRLSDFGRYCADSVFWRPGIAGRHQVTLIFDDNIQFGRDSFSAFAKYTGGIGVGGFGVLYDLRELRSDVLVSIIYKNVLESGAKLNSILDLQGRMKTMKARALSFGYEVDD